MSTLHSPTLFEPTPLTRHWSVLPSFLPVPGLGALAVNSFLCLDDEPLLVDTGLAALGEGFMEALGQRLDPRELRWIWLSHLDADHTGNLARVLAAAPKARVLTGFLGMGKMNLAGLDVSRVELIEPGKRIEVGGRSLLPLRPPYYDAPETLGFFDPRERVLFAADSFGALLPDPVADFEAIGGDALREGLAVWSSIDAPWLASIDRAAFGRSLSALRRLAPELVLSAHLPAARGAIDQLTGLIDDTLHAGLAEGIDPLSIEAIIAEWEPC